MYVSFYRFIHADLPWNWAEWRHLRPNLWSERFPQKEMIFHFDRWIFLQIRLFRVGTLLSPFWEIECLFTKLTASAASNSCYKSSISKSDAHCYLTSALNCQSDHSIESPCEQSILSYLQIGLLSCWYWNPWSQLAKQSIPCKSQNNCSQFQLADAEISRDPFSGRLTAYFRFLFISLCEDRHNRRLSWTKTQFPLLRFHIDFDCHRLARRETLTTIYST
jgi:hypothetical protein